MSGGYNALHGNHEAWNMELVGHSDLAGSGDGMLVNVQGAHAYVGHMGEGRIGTSILDVSDPTAPKVLSQLETRPGTHSHKVQVVDDLLVVNCEMNKREHDPASWEAGIKIFDISDPSSPRQIGFFETPGAGVHRMTYWEHPYVFVAGTDEGYVGRFFRVVDLSDPTRPREVGRWWMQGQHAAGGEAPTWREGERFNHHHASIRGDRAYCGWWDAGLVILDISDLEKPSLVSHLDFGDESRSTHSVLPLDHHPSLVVTDEETYDDCELPRTDVRVVDITDEANPKVTTKLPVPEGDFCGRGGRFGPHNLHEPRPGSLQSTERVFLTYFNAGIRVVDVRDPANPKEEGYFIPEAPPGRPAIQLNDLTVDADGLIYVTDRYTGGLYIMRFTG